MISTEKGKELAKTFNMEFFEASAKTGHNIEAAFDFIIDLIIQKNYLWQMMQ